MRHLVGEAASRLGWEVSAGESHLDAMLRGLLLGTLGRQGCPDTTAEARRRLEAHEKGDAALPADLRSAVYSTVLRNGSATELERLTKLYHAADLQEEKVRILRNLGVVPQEENIKKVLEFAMSEHVRSQDTVFGIGGVTGSIAGRDAAWKFLQDNWKELHTRYEGGFLLARLVKFTTENFSSEDKAKEVAAFFEANPAPAADRTVQQSLENIRLNKHQLERDGAAIKAFLASQG